MALDSRAKSSLASFLGIVLSILAAFIIAIILIFSFSKDPAKTLYWYFFGPFTNPFVFGNMLESAIPLLFTGLGMAVAFKSGVTNLGGEGQIFAGAIMAVILGVLLPNLPGGVGIPTLLLGGAIVGSLMAGLSGFLRMAWGVSDLLTTYLISTGMVYVINYLILGPLRDPAQITIQSLSIPAAYMLPRLLPPSYLHAGLLLGLAAAVFIWFLIYRTHLGYELRVAGSNRQFGRYGGIEVRQYLVVPMLISGALIGLGGAVQVVGRYGSCFTDLTAGLGWNGIAVALIARSNPLGVIPAAIFYAYLDAGAKSAMINSDITYEIASIISAVIFYLVTAEAAVAFIRRRLGK
ncbi:MAG: ABC transporter permease [Coprothermobacterota bacterium]|nr:ABC transporter permease [Coprothermobacterota bacterium]